MTKQFMETWGAGGPYEHYVGRWSRVVAREFLDWLEIPPGESWGDVGCGTGALVERILATADPGRICAIDRSRGFIMDARSAIKDPRVQFEVADATALPWSNECCDATVSGLVLNFVPDASAMVKEMARVTRTHGRVAAYVWDYRDGMQMMRQFWEAAISVDAEAARLDQAERFPLCQPEPLLSLFRDAGLAVPIVQAINIPTVFRDFDDYWRPFLGKQGAAPTYLASVNYETQNRIRERLESRLIASPDGSIHLSARAWAVQARV